MTIWASRTEGETKRPIDLIVLCGMSMALALWFSYSFVFEMWGERGFSDTPEIWIVVVFLQGMLQFGLRVGCRKPVPAHRRSIRDWVHLWMVSSMVVCALGVACQLLTGRMEAAVLMFYQAVIPTAFCLAAFIESAAYRSVQSTEAEAVPVVPRTFMSSELRGLIKVDHATTY